MKNKRNIKFNILDFLIIVFVISVVAAVFLRNGIASNLTASKKNLQYTLKISDVQAESYDYIKPGTIVYSDDDNREIGKVVSVEPAQLATFYTVLSDGNIKKTEQPNRIDIYLTVETSGTVDSEGYKIDGKIFIASGKTIEVYINGIYFNVEVRDVWEKL